MLGLSDIQQVNDEKAAEAAEEGKVPYVYSDIAEVDRRSGFPFPHLGDYIPEGWRKYADEGGLFFVDSSGWGEGNESALTAEAFKSEIKKIITVNEFVGWDIGWAIVEAGQFQVYVQAFKKEV